MPTKAMIDEFFAQDHLALMRPTPQAKVMGCRVDKELTKKGYNVSVVYLDANESGTGLADLETPVGGLMIAVPRDQAERAVQQAIDAKVPRIWLQEGSETEAAIKLGQDNDISVIHGACILMFAEPVKSFHAFHRWIWKLLGKLPQ